ncbi:hypothetical protein R1sor_023314 [Riccia sorocarpa]|uniref:Reverse transcriptase zinc-binding domain-containing protein n=1 Tax=Riccia sorocarpa TaxID=122646 RepID=A0ABD3GMA1_9MARC
MGSRTDVWRGWQWGIKFWRNVVSGDHITDDLADKMPREQNGLNWRRKWKSFCNVEVKTTGHLLWSCRDAKMVWDNMRESAFLLIASFSVKQSLLATTDEALEAKKKGSTLIFILGAILQTRWQDRNNMYFRNQRLRNSRRTSLMLARYKIGASFNNKSSDQRWTYGLIALQGVNSFIRHVELPRNDREAETITTDFLTFRLETEPS